MIGRSESGGPAIRDERSPAATVDGRRPSALRRLLRKGPPVIHPFLMAAFPIVFLFARNLYEAITARDMILPLELSLGATAILMLAGWAVFRNAKAVGFVVSAWLLLFFSYGRVSSGLAGEALGQDRYVLATWAVLAVAAVIVAFLLRSRLTATTSALNLITAVLVVMNVIPITLYRPPHRSNAASKLTGQFAKPLVVARNSTQMPDIYYIMPEDYGDEITLREKYGVDTRAFVKYLEKQGFYVAHDSKTNYNRTNMALSAAGNLQYLSTLLGDAAKEDDAVDRSLPGFAASRFLQALGYRYVHMGYWWSPTSADPTADIEVKSGTLSEFSSILNDTTILPTLSRKLDVKQEFVDPRRAHHEQVLQELRDIVQTSKLRGPKFVFAHLGIPHPAYIFDRQGRFVAGSRERDLGRFADQVYFTTKKLQELIGQLLDATGRKAVIILQTDEGPDPTHKLRIHIEKGRFEREELLLKYRILNAFFLPGVSRRGLYQSITPVNTFRLVFDLYFHTDFGFLPDEIWARTRNPTKFINITKLFEKA